MRFFPELCHSGVSPIGPFHTFQTGHKEFCGLRRESETLFRMIDLCWLLVNGKQGYCNFVERNRSKGDVWFFKINVFQTGNVIEWPCTRAFLSLATMA